MKLHLQQLFAFGLLVGAEANYLSWPRDEAAWFMPRETGAVKHSDSGVDPVPTSPAKYAPGNGLAVGHANGLAKRADESTCGYVSGDPTWSFYCGVGYCFEAVNTVSDYSMVDCCTEADINSCTAATTCLDSTDSSLAGSTSRERTYLCTDSEYPKCVTYMYGGGTLSGYTWLNCGKTATVRTVFQTASGTTTDGTTSDSTTSSPTSSTSSSSTTSSSTTSSSNSGGGSKSNVGPIVGGVVGGIGGIALIVGIVAFCIVRNKRKNPNGQNLPPAGQPQPQMAASVPPQGGPGAPPQSIYGGPPPSVDPRQSMIKPGYYPDGSSYMGSPPGSPPPPQQGGSPMQAYNVGQPQYNNAGQQQYQPYGPVSPQQGGTPPVPFQPVGGYGDPHQHTPTPPMGQQQYAPPPPQQQQPQYSELPAARGDGELRELA